MRRALAVTWLAGLLAAPISAADPPRENALLFARTEDREPCARFDPLRQPHFGDLHVHTAFSQDASTQGTRAQPRDAYRFARGEALGIQPFDANAKALRSVQLSRPLDFAAVTDHAEQIGEVHLCSTPGAPGHDSLVCQVYRRAPRVAFFLMNARYSAGGSRWGWCGAGGEQCLAAARTVWQEIRDAAEGAYDRSAACRFTSFVGYEWTAGVDTGKNLHRNVIFRNDVVPDVPITVMETGPTAKDLWDRLQRDCIDGRPGCHVLTIPHNSNLDAGLMFQSATEIGTPIGRAEAQRRARWEPLVEVMQHKGDSECLLAGDTTDEACGFEKLPYDNFGGRYAFVGADPPKRSQFVREALKRGLQLEAELGANPFRYGIIASTDTHLGTPGLVSEQGFPGHGGAGDPSGSELPPGLPDAPEFGPGGLAVLWSEENSRDSLFAAMERREAYGTSGPRLVVRFFGGWDYADAMCQAHDFAAQGYAAGVPMGGDLAEPPAANAAPRFAVMALRDVGVRDEPHALLQRVQIVKGWQEGGALREQIVDVAGGPNAGGVDPSTCALRAGGNEQLCAVWSDPDFEPSQRAFYYARVLENPSCRWSQYVCIANHVDCAEPETIGEGLEGCCAAEHQPTQQERAWTSPIWYTP